MCSQEAQHNVGPPFPPPDHAQLDPELTSVRHPSADWSRDCRVLVWQTADL